VQVGSLKYRAAADRNVPIVTIEWVRAARLLQCRRNALRQQPDARHWICGRDARFLCGGCAHRQTHGTDTSD
jgi:hypothetical protein